MNVVVLAIVYVTSPLYHGALSEIAAIVAAHVVVLLVIARRLREDVRTFQLELDGLVTLTA